jgi:hypothetical protein
MERRNATINDSHPTKTPHEQVTKRPPLFSQLTAYHFGALAAAKVVGPHAAVARRRRCGADAAAGVRRLTGDLAELEAATVAVSAPAPLPP